jgi:hypothetical protein
MTPNLGLINLLEWLTGLRQTHFCRAVTRGADEQLHEETG